MGVYLNPSNNGFKRAVQSKIYVDKTELIVHTNEVINTMQGYVCVSRPRRFGKSTTASMLTAYYCKSYDSSNLFAPFAIAKQEETFKAHLNQYNVIALNIQKFSGMVSSMKALINCIQNEVLEEIRECYSDMILENENILHRALSRLYSKKDEQFIFVIDEWDCVLRDKDFTQEERRLYLKFLETLLKDQDYVALVYMTGILPVKKYGKQSALNMFMEYSMIEPSEYAEYVGFTEKEVKSLCEQYEKDFNLMKEWYDGYNFGKSIHIYNPKSVVDSIIRKQYSNYWTQTENYDSLRTYISMNFDGLKDAILTMLAGEPVKINTRSFQNDMFLLERKDDVLTLLIHFGYLAYNKDTQSVWIPNTEIQEEFKNAVECSNWKEVVVSLEQSEELLQATWNLDGEEVAKRLNVLHSENTSILTYNDENSLSCVISLAYYNAVKEYTRIREFPSGKGFADVVYIPRKTSDKPAMIIELKYDKSAEGAIEQIKNRQYVEALKEYNGNLLLVGINYDKKSKTHQCVIEKFFK